MMCADTAGRSVGKAAAARLMASSVSDRENRSAPSGPRGVGGGPLVAGGLSPGGRGGLSGRGLSPRRGAGGGHEYRCSTSSCASAGEDGGSGGEFRRAKTMAYLQPLQPNDVLPDHHSLLRRSTSADDSESSEEPEFDLHPLIKQELRHSIQKRRWERGALDWALEDYDKKRQQHNQMTDDEILKRDDRRKRNRQAAAKCRRKRRTEIEKLHQTLDELDSQRQELERLKDHLHREKRQLEKMVNDHFALCHSDKG